MEFSTSVTTQLSQQGESNRKMKSKESSDLAYEKAFEKILDCINSLHGFLAKKSSSLFKAERKGSENLRSVLGFLPEIVATRKIYQSLCMEKFQVVGIST